MRACPWIALAIVLSGASAFASAAALRIPEVRAALLTTDLNFGEIVPSAGDTPREAIATIQVFSSEPWQITLVPQATTIRRRAAGVVQSSSGRPELLVQADNVWLPATAGITFNGPPTTGAGTFQTVWFRVMASFDTAPGPRRDDFVILLNGVPLPEQLHVGYEVGATMELTSDSSTFTLTQTDPSRPRPQAFAPRRFLVRSNVPWVMEVGTTAPLTERGGNAVLPDAAVRVRDRDGTYRSLIGRVEIAAGQPTGIAGTPVIVNLLLDAPSTPRAGEYSADIGISVRRTSGADGLSQP